jgi:VanZ family protein
VRRILLWVPAAVYMAAIFFVSGQPSPPMPAALSDKVLHGIAYFGLAVLVLYAIQNGRPGRLTWSQGAAALLITIGYAATDELHQLLVPGRSADPRDLLADAAGATTAVAAWWAMIGNPKSQIPNPKSQA